VRYANIDDRLMVWIDGSLVTFDQPTEYDSHRFRTAEARRPYWSAEDPLDAAPAAVGGQAIDLTVHRARVWRDIYYIAIRPGFYADYSTNDLMTVINSIRDPEIRSLLQRDSDGPIDVISWIYANPELWATTPLFSKRGTLEYQLGKGEFFPMGDNSAASSDARDWAGHHYVERRFLIGKALLVFWPHRWNAPVPYPNFARMGRIR
jgi:signal peptidase I